jgi:hypothetical protein
LETLEGVLLQGEYSVRRLRAFKPQEGTELVRKQEEFEKKLERQLVDNETDKTGSTMPQEDQSIESEDKEEQSEEEDEIEGKN